MLVAVKVLVVRLDGLKVVFDDFTPAVFAGALVGVIGFIGIVLLFISPFFLSRIDIIIFF